MNNYQTFNFAILSWQESFYYHYLLNKKNFNRGTISNDFLFENFSKNPEVRLPNLFNYIDARDLGQAVDLCIQKDGLGYEVFNVGNDNNSVDLNNDQIRKRFYSGVPMKFEIGSNECVCFLTEN